MVSTLKALDGKTRLSNLVKLVGSLPSVAAKVVSLSRDPNVEISQLTKLIESDASVTVRVLALANSAAMSRGHRIRDLNQALVRLGLARVRNVALCLGFHDMVHQDRGGDVMDRVHFWRHTLGVAACAKTLAETRSKVTPEDAYLVGLLHGVGVPALDQWAAQDFGRAVDMARKRRCSLTEAEMEIFEFHHGTLGGRILAEWNLPKSFIDVLENYPRILYWDNLDPEVSVLITLIRQSIAICRATGLDNYFDGDPPISLHDLARIHDMDGQFLTELGEKVLASVNEMSDVIGLEVPPEALSFEAIEELEQEVAEIGLAGTIEGLARGDLEKQLSLARSIQQRLLPRENPKLDNFDLAAVNMPSLQVSGDYYDFVQLPDGRWCLSIADVSGKGVPASLLASNIQASMRALATFHTSPGKILETMNDLIWQSTDPEKFATFFLGALDQESGEFSYASAGHDPPLLLRASGEKQWLGSVGTPLGVVPGMAYPEEKVVTAAGDVLVLYTDGVTESADDSYVEFGEEGLLDVVQRNSTLSAGEIVLSIHRAVQSHSATKLPEEIDAGSSTPDTSKREDAADDVTLIVLRALSPA